MLWVYVPRGASLERVPIESGAAVAENAVWFDLVNPNLEEDKAVERQVGISIPTREEMQEIEVTSRLYVENGARYMTATLMCQSDTMTPKTTPVTFILSDHRLITVRYDDPRPFMIVGNKLARLCPPAVTGEAVLIDLLDAVIDRAADILERIGSEVDQISHDIFEPEAEGADRTRSYNEILKAIGKKGDLASKVRESLVSIGRLLLFLANEADSMRWAKEQRAQVRGNSVSARCHARGGHDRAEQRHQDIFGGGRGADAAHADCVDLWHEFQAHARARLVAGVSNRHRADAVRSRSAVPFLQVEEVALS